MAGCAGGGSAGDHDHGGEQRAAPGPGSLAEALPAEEELAEPAEPGRRALLDRFAAAIQDADASALAELLRDDVALEMPPLLTWFTGRQTVTRFFASRALDVPGRFRLVPVTANGQPAFAVYRREHDGAYRAYSVTVPTVTATGIARIVTFLSPGLFGSFGLPQEYRAAAAGLVPAQDQAVPRGPAEQGDGTARINCQLRARRCRAGPRRIPGIRLVYISRPPTERRRTHRTRENRHVGK